MDKAQSRSSKFLKDIGIYAVGSLGSKLITFLLVPLYTYYVSPAEYGCYDLCLTAAMLLMHFLSLTMREGGFRFLIDADDDKERSAIITFVYRILITNSSVAIILGGIIAFTYPIEYMWETIGLLISLSVYEVVIQLVRGLGKNSYFVAAGITSSFLIGALSILFVVVLDLKIEGIFLANIIARLLTLAILELKLGVMRKYFDLRKSSKECNKALLKYSLPLIPGAVCWWLMGSCNRWFIQHYIGLESNGQYAVALKFATILETLAYIFYQTWQETALRQYNSPDRDRFFSNIYNNYVYVLLSGVVLFSFALKMNYSWLVGGEFSYSVNYIYPLCISAVLFSLSAFYEMGYQCRKKTIFTLPGVALAAVVNVVCNYFLIQRFDVYGVVGTSVITYFVLCVYRAIDTRRYFKIKYERYLLLPLLLLVISGAAFYLIDSVIWLATYFVGVLIVIAAFAPAEIKNMIVSRLRKFRG